MKNYIIGFLAVLLFIGLYLLIDNILFDGFKPQEIHQDGFQGNYYAQNEAKNQVAVILLGGGQWGDYWGRQFAQNGYVGLSLPYTRKEGLPTLPEEIPLEYFENALKWLGKQEAVNPSKILVMGASRNAELALVLASVMPQKINGVVAYAPSSVSWSNTVLPFNSDELKPSWTYKGVDIPYIPMEKISPNTSSEINTLAYWKSGLQNLEEHEKASIRVENINGPILLFSGKEDGVWPSVEMANEIESRLLKHEFQYPFHNIQFENAGHLISTNPDIESNEPDRNGFLTIEGKAYEYSLGGTAAGDQKAKLEAREKLYEFLKGFL